MLRTVDEIVEHHRPAQSCEGCPFGGPRVGSKGNPRAPIVIVAESPGIEEVKAKEPLVGPSGQLFHEYVPNAGEEGDVYILNALECRPPQSLKGEERMTHATHCCRNRLIEKIAAHPRKIIIAMGNPAVRSLTGDDSLKITQIRGKLIESPLAELGIMPIVHIAALMRGGGSFKQWSEDIEYAFHLANDGKPKQHIPGRVKFTPPAYLMSQKWVDYLFEKVLLAQSNELTGDIETSDLHFLRGRILSLGITPANNKAISYCFYPEHFPLLKKWLESKRVSWCWHNGKFDIKWFRTIGIEARVDDDTMLMSYALDENPGTHDLETLSGNLFGAPDYKHMIKPWLPTKDSSYALVPRRVLGEYQAIDTCNTAQLRTMLRPLVAKDPDLEKLYTQTLIPASELLARVEMNGFHVDVERLSANERYYHGDPEAPDLETRLGVIGTLQQQADDLLGFHINLGSAQQVSRVLFKHYKFRNRSKGSTDEDTLKWLQANTDGHPFIGILMKHRKAAKMYGTYVKGLRKWIAPDGRIHCTYKIHGTRTGRLSSNEPNMQNIPREVQIKGTFVAAPGYELLEVDLSQAELRSLTALSGDPVLMEIYLNDLDLHSDLAVYLFGDEWKDKYYNYAEDTPEYRWAKEKRVKCKNVNFGIIYGITKWGLCEQINDTPAVAQEMLDAWFARYHVAGEFIKMCRGTVARNQILTTVFGRKKRVGVVSRQNLSFLQNEAANFPHQSIASDITLTAAIRCEPRLRAMGVRIVNLVHDSIIMEVPTAGWGMSEWDDNPIRRAAAQLVKHELEQVPIDVGITRVPFVADAEYGDRWGYLRGYDIKEAA